MSFIVKNKNINNCAPNTIINPKSTTTNKKIEIIKKFKGDKIILHNYTKHDCVYKDKNTGKYKVVANAKILIYSHISKDIIINVLKIMMILK